MSRIRATRRVPLRLLAVFAVIAAESIFLVIGAASTSSTAAAAALQTATVTPVADAYVDAGRPNNAFGTKGDLKADATPVKRTFIRFDVQGVSGTVTKATLRLFARRGTSVGFDVRDVSDDTWTETVTYNTAPVASSTVTRSSGSYGSN